MPILRRPIGLTSDLYRVQTSTNRSITAAMDLDRESPFVELSDVFGEDFMSDVDCTAVLCREPRVVLVWVQHGSGFAVGKADAIEVDFYEGCVDPLGRVGIAPVLIM